MIGLVTMMAVMMLMVPMMAEDAHAELTATSGDGTAENPYSGTLSDDFYVSNNPPAEVYVLEGTTFSIMLIEIETDGYSVTEGFGLGIEIWKFSCGMTGTATGTGDCVLSHYGTAITTFHIVSEAQQVSQLEFLSNPVDDAVIKYTGT